MFFISIMAGLFLGGTVFAQSEERSLPEDPALETPVLITDPLPYYDYHNLDYGMTIGIERTPTGRIWACWVAGGDDPEAFFVLNFSDDDGKTWSKPKLVIDPHDPGLEMPRRVLIGALWRDPSDRLWLFFDQSMEMFDGRAGVWYTICENSDSKHPQWSEPRRIWHGSTLNKPNVMKDGTYVLPVSLWQRKNMSDSFEDDAYPELDSLRMANVLISKDRGLTWERRGGVLFPNPRFDEHHILERENGEWWMTARTNNGIWQSSSYDQGKTWSAPTKYLEHISSRHFIRRLQSGKMILVKHGDVNEKTKTRSKLSAYLSDDEGRTWTGGLMLDERRGVSYPDGFQAPDGTIYVSYDRNRSTDGEILMARFTEADVLSGKFSGKKSKARILISKPLGLDKLPPPSERIRR